MAWVDMTPAYDRALRSVQPRSRWVAARTCPMWVAHSCDLYDKRVRPVDNRTGPSPGRGTMAA
ncbi:hypothetical protein SGFS_085590 [Streptomyces graminofaciens]|uniref:Transposase n=1 Tax=Streptomyces graminofaciens TaxID=68212 RepID=A0ABM7FLR7_9ACTN|nr:hypothetical protein SGFS_085590 [Streptomyces graminofaciens]